MFYAAVPGIKRGELTKLVDNMAVTLKVHPYNLLIEYEETGHFRVGQGIRLTVCVIHNVAAAAEVRKLNGENQGSAVESDKECSQRITYTDQESDQHVPARIWGMRLSNDDSVKVVVVTEHRNIGRSKWMSDNMTGVILVMVSHTVCATAEEN